MLRTNAMPGFEGREAAVDDKIEYLFYEFGRFPLSETGEKQIPVCSLSGRVGLDLANHVQNGAVSGFQHGHHLVLPFQVVRTAHQGVGLFLQAFDGDVGDTRLVKTLHEVGTQGVYGDAVVESKFLGKFSEFPMGHACLSVLFNI